MQGVHRGILLGQSPRLGIAVELGIVLGRSLHQGLDLLVLGLECGLVLLGELKGQLIGILAFVLAPGALGAARVQATSDAGGLGGGFLKVVSRGIHVGVLHSAAIGALGVNGALTRAAGRGIENDLEIVAGCLDGGLLLFAAGADLDLQTRCGAGDGLGVGLGQNKFVHVALTAEQRKHECDDQ